MRKFTLEFSTENDAFGDNDKGERSDETQRILEHIGFLVSEGYTSGPVHDSNGNSIGKWGFE